LFVVVISVVISTWCSNIRCSLCTGIIWSSGTSKLCHIKQVMLVSIVDSNC